MRAALFSFSQTGTTSAIGQRIGEGLEASGVAVKHASISPEADTELTDIDIVGVGTPAHIFRPPWIVKDFVWSLPELGGRGFFSFVLYGSSPGATGNRLRQWLERKGGRDLGYYSARGADRFLGYLREGVLFSPGRPNQAELEGAFEFGRLVARRGMSEMTGREPKDPGTPLLYVFERAMTNRALIWGFYSRFFWADTRCISCEKCVRECPTENIRMKAEGHPIWARRCIMCGRCSMVCPVDAVHCPWDWWWSRLIMKVNIRKGIDAGVPYERVAFDSAGSSEEEKGAN